MALNLLQDKGIPISQQRFTWKDLVQTAHQQDERRRIHAGADHFDERY